MDINLQYGYYNAGVLHWIEPPTHFNAVRVLPKDRVTRDNGFDLRQVPYTNRLAKRQTWELTVSADELISDEKMTFMRNFYAGSAWRYGGEVFGYGYSYGYGYANVFLEDKDDMPLTFIEDDLNLPEITLKLIEKDPT